MVMKQQVVIFGTGTHYLHHKYLLDNTWEVIAFADNDINKIGKKFEGKKVIAASDLTNNLKYSYIVVATTAKDQVIKQLLGMGISDEKIKVLNCYGLVEPQFVKTEVLQDGRTLFQIEDISFYCDTRSDYNVVQELYDDGSYYFRQRKHNYVVIDVGMNTGIAALYFAQLDWVSKVYGYEPFQETYLQATKNFLVNKQEIQNKIIFHNFGLDSKTVTKQINYHADFSGGMSTEYEADILDENIVEVKLLKADAVVKDIIDKNGSEKILLKVDCEGSEYSIFTDLYESNLLDKMDVILLEWHNAGKNALLERQLLDSGFLFVKHVGNGGRGFIYAGRG